MYNDAWDDYYDHREDAREDWTDHREDVLEERAIAARISPRTVATARVKHRNSAPNDSRTVREPAGSTRLNATRAQPMHQTRDSDRSTSTTGPGARAATNPAATRRARVEPPLKSGAAPARTRSQAIRAGIGTRGEFARNEQSEPAREPQQKRRRRDAGDSPLTAVGLLAAALAAQSLIITAQSSAQRTFATPEDAVRALIEAATPGKTGRSAGHLRLRGPGADRLVRRGHRPPESADVHRRRRRGLALADEGADRKVLIVGDEGWPFPVPLVKGANGWRFDTAAGKEEVLARRIGATSWRPSAPSAPTSRRSSTTRSRGTTARPRASSRRSSRAIRASRTACIGRVNGRSREARLATWWRRRHRKASSWAPVAVQPAPFHGYYFKILTGQGAAARGGAKSYLVNGEMSGGFALVAWPAQYDATGVMTFIVNQDGVVHEKDLGSQTGATAAAMTRYNPDASWRRVQ